MVQFDNMTKESQRRLIKFTGSRLLCLIQELELNTGMTFEEIDFNLEHHLKEYRTL